MIPTILDRARIFYNCCSSWNYSALENKNFAKFRGEISGACLKTNDEIITSSFKPELLVPSNSRMKRSKEVSWYSLILIGFHWFIDLSGKYFGKYFDLKKIFQKIKCYEVLGSSLLPSSLPSTSYRGVRSSRSWSGLPSGSRFRMRIKNNCSRFLFKLTSELFILKIFTRFRIRIRHGLGIQDYLLSISHFRWWFLCANYWPFRHTRTLYKNLYFFQTTHFIVGNARKSLYRSGNKMSRIQFRISTCKYVYLN